MVRLKFGQFGIYFCPLKFLVTVTITYDQAFSFYGGVQNLANGQVKGSNSSFPRKIYKGIETVRTQARVTQLSCLALCLLKSIEFYLH